MSETKSGENLQILSSWICSISVWKIIISAIDAPNLLSHIYTHGNTATGLNKQLFRYHIQKLVKLKLIKCLTPNLKSKEPGKVYDLTRRGLRVKEIICDKENKDCLYKRLDNIDWYIYGKVILGSQRVVLLRTLDNYPQRIYEIVGKIKRKLHYKTYMQKTKGHPSDKAWGMVRQNVNNTLRWLIKKELVISEQFPGKRKRNKLITKYRLTEEGELIKKQIGYLAN